ncbi:ABC transporter permease [Candidatus Sumerlaeota bacterium]|nr:ABC transporter permease [Candidatus Sumerlaeota bacterium]
MTAVLKRLLEAIPTLIGVTLLTFFMGKLTPGDPARLMLGPEATEEAIQQFRKEHGFDRPIIEQYFIYMKKLMKGDMGTSITTGKRPVVDEIMTRLPATLELLVFSMVFAVLTSVIAGVLSAVYPRSLIDNVTRFLVFIFLAMPSFWLGLEMIILFSQHLKWFPPAGRGVLGFESRIAHIFMPSLVIGVGTGAFLCRILRSSMLEVLRADYVRTARAKGLHGWAVVMKHALKNALIPFITVTGISMGTLLGGSVIVETVFNWPGIGKLLVESIHERNLPVTMGCVLIMGGGFVLINLLTDILYTVIDPRISLEGDAAT